MIFTGTGLVKWRGKKIANFIEGVFETTEPRVIQRLTELGFGTTQSAVISEEAKKWSRTNSVYFKKARKK